MKKTPKQVIVVRTDLNMRKGKLAAQVAHASMKVIFNYMYKINSNRNDTKNIFLVHLPLGESGEYMNDWINGIFTKIVVGTKSEEELFDLYAKAIDAGLPCAIIEDLGITEFHGNKTTTAIAIGPDDPDKIDKITGHLNLL